MYTHCCDFLPLNMHNSVLFMCSTPKKLWSIKLLQIKIKFENKSRSSDWGAKNKAFRFYFFSRELRDESLRGKITTFFYLMVRNTIVYIRISTVLVWLVKNPKLCSLSPGEVPSLARPILNPASSPAFDHLSSCFFFPFIYYPVGFIGNGFWYIKKMVGWGGVGWTGGGCLTFLARQYCTGLTRSHALKFFFPLEEEEINGIFF